MLLTQNYYKIRRDQYNMAQYKGPRASDYNAAYDPFQADIYKVSKPLTSNSTLSAVVQQPSKSVHSASKNPSNSKLKRRVVRTRLRRYTVKMADGTITGGFYDPNDKFDWQNINNNATEDSSESEAERGINQTQESDPDAGLFQGYTNAHYAEAMAALSEEERAEMLRDKYDEREPYPSSEDWSERVRRQDKSESEASLQSPRPRPTSRRPTHENLAKNTSGDAATDARLSTTSGQEREQATPAPQAPKPELQAAALASSRVGKDEPVYGEPLNLGEMKAIFPEHTVRPNWAEIHKCEHYNILKRILQTRRSAQYREGEGSNVTFRYIPAQVITQLAITGRVHVVDSVTPLDKMLFPDSLRDAETAHEFILTNPDNERAAQHLKRYPWLPLQHDLPHLADITGQEEWDFTARTWNPPPPTKDNWRKFIYAPANIRHGGRMYAANCRHRVAGWNEHPWCEICLVNAGIDPCEKPPKKGAVPVSDCYICNRMSRAMRIHVHDLMVKKKALREALGHDLPVNTNLLPAYIRQQLHADRAESAKNKQNDRNPAWKDGIIGFCRPMYALPYYYTTRQLVYFIKKGMDLKYEVQQHLKSFLKEYDRISEKYPDACVDLQNLTIHVRKLKDESKESPKTEEELEVRMINEISPEKQKPGPISAKLRRMARSSQSDSAADTSGQPLGASTENPVDTTENEEKSPPVTITRRRSARNQTPATVTPPVKKQKQKPRRKPAKKAEKPEVETPVTPPQAKGGPACIQEQKREAKKQKEEKIRAQKRTIDLLHYTSGTLSADEDQDLQDAIAESCATLAKRPSPDRPRRMTRQSAVTAKAVIKKKLEDEEKPSPATPTATRRLSQLSSLGRFGLETTTPLNSDPIVIQPKKADSFTTPATGDYAILPWQQRKYSCNYLASDREHHYSQYNSAILAAREISATARAKSDVQQPAALGKWAAQSLLSTPTATFTPENMAVDHANTVLQAYKPQVFDPNLGDTIPFYWEDFPDSCITREITLKQVGDSSGSRPQDSDLVGLLQAEVRRLDDQNRAMTKLMESDQFFLKALTERFKALDEQRKPEEKLRKPHSDEMKVLDALHINLLKREYLLGNNLGIITAVRRRDTLTRRDMSDQRRADLVSQPVQVVPTEWVHQALAMNPPPTSAPTSTLRQPETQVTTKFRVSRSKPQSEAPTPSAEARRQQDVRTPEKSYRGARPKQAVQQRLPDGSAPKMSFEEGVRALRMRVKLGKPLEQLERHILHGPSSGQPGSSSDEN